MKIQNSRSAFSLIEIMVAISIIGILAAVVMTSMQRYGVKARTSRAMVQASSALPAMVSCAGNKGWTSINAPSEGGNICGSDSNYGLWPDLPDNYDYSTTISGSSVGSFFFSVTNTESSPTICCNSRMNSCGQPDSSCSESATW